MDKIDITTLSLEKLKAYLALVKNNKLIKTGDDKSHFESAIRAISSDDEFNTLFPAESFDFSGDLAKKKLAAIAWLKQLINDTGADSSAEIEIAKRGGAEQAATIGFKGLATGLGLFTLPWILASGGAAYYGFSGNVVFTLFGVAVTKLAITVAATSIIGLSGLVFAGVGFYFAYSLERNKEKRAMQRLFLLNAEKKLTEQQRDKMLQHLKDQSTQKQKDYSDGLGKICEEIISLANELNKNETISVFNEQDLQTIEGKKNPQDKFAELLNVLKTKINNPNIDESSSEACKTLFTKLSKIETAFQSNYSNYQNISDTLSKSYEFINNLHADALSEKLQANELTKNINDFVYQQSIKFNDLFTQSEKDQLAKINLEENEKIKREQLHDFWKKLIPTSNEKALLQDTLLAVIKTGEKAQELVPTKPKSQPSKLRSLLQSFLLATSMMALAWISSSAPFIFIASATLAAFTNPIIIGVATLVFVAVLVGAAVMYHRGQQKEIHRNHLREQLKHQCTAFSEVGEAIENSERKQVTLVANHQDNLAKKTKELVHTIKNQETSASTKRENTEMKISQSRQTLFKPEFKKTSPADKTENDNQPEEEEHTSIVPNKSE